MDRNERIRAKAHELWEREGRPEGRHEAHWEQAMREIEAAEGGDPSAVRRDPDTGAGLAGDPTGQTDLAGEGAPAASGNMAGGAGHGAMVGMADPAPRARRRTKE